MLFNFGCSAFYRLFIFRLFESKTFPIEILFIFYCYSESFNFDSGKTIFKLSICMMNLFEFQMLLNELNNN